MIFSIDADSNQLDRLHGQSFSDLGLLERQDLQEWVIKEPGILGEELLRNPYRAKFF